MERPARREQQRCEYCEFYAQGETIVSNPDGSDGACRRYAPRGTVRTASGVSEYRWPTVKETDWCGEFERFTPEVKEGDGII